MCYITIKKKEVRSVTFSIYEYQATSRQTFSKEREYFRLDTCRPLLLLDTANKLLRITSCTHSTG